MNNFKQPGNVVTLTAPGGGVASGLGYLIGQLFVVAVTDVAATLPFEGQTVGVFELPNTAVTFAEGDLVYWDISTDEATTFAAKATGDMLIGTAVEAAVSVAVDVRLDGVARILEA